MKIIYIRRVLSFSKTTSLESISARFIIFGYKMGLYIHICIYTKKKVDGNLTHADNTNITNEAKK